MQPGMTDVSRKRERLSFVVSVARSSIQEASLRGFGGRACPGLWLVPVRLVQGPGEAGGLWPRGPPTAPASCPPSWMKVPCPVGP